MREGTKRLGMGRYGSVWAGEQEGVEKLDGGGEIMAGEQFMHDSLCILERKEVYKVLLEVRPHFARLSY